MYTEQSKYDIIIIGAGVSGPFLAQQFCEQGLKVLMLEAGESLDKDTYPTKEIDSNSRLYWGGGIELNTRADLALLRPKVVGGGSLVNQALLDRFDDIALDSWKEVSQIDYFNRKLMDPWYEKAEAELSFQEIPEEQRNENALIFKQGFEKNGYNWAPLTRAQKDCHYEDGNDCIECLSGCRIDSKQSSSITVLRKTKKEGLTLVSRFEVQSVKEKNGIVTVEGVDRYGQRRSYHAGHLCLAAGAIGNSKLLLNSGFGEEYPNLGKNFYCHPQSMVLGIYEHEINSHKGAFQSLKSADANFRANSFKLENVFGPPVAISMLLPGAGVAHMSRMKQLSHMACIEVAIRDKNPGQITVDSKGRQKIHKELSPEDKDTQKKGFDAIHKIFNSTGATEIVNGEITIGLHLMGGLGIGADPSRSVVNPEFRLHGRKNIFCADSSIFPNAPGINPSLTIMALNKMAGEKILRAL
jgi:choline dehydrogenase-like flavoprotein